MATTEKKTLNNLAADPETGRKTREALDYYVTLPSGYDPGRAYGLAFSIVGWDDAADAAHQSEAIRPYIADKYDLITVGLRYHNDARFNGNYQLDLLGIGRFLGVGDRLLEQNAGNLDGILNRIFELMVSLEVKQLDPRLAAKSGALHQYTSFGFLPALEHLAVLHELNKDYKIDKRNIIACGTGYGGYIASLLGKYAPFTFSLIIDNSGFCLADTTEIWGGAIGRVNGAFARSIDGQRYEIPIAADTLWSIDETSPYYFSDAHRQIRSLLAEGHRTASPTMYCCYHSVQDELVPVAQKDKLCKILALYNPVYYKRVEEKDLGGALFSSLRHGMDASLKGIFDLSMEKYHERRWGQGGLAPGAETQPDNEGAIDFDRNVTYGFPCSDKLYNFSYTDAGLDVRITSLYV